MNMHFSTGNIFKITCNSDSKFLYIGSTFTSIFQIWKSYICQYNKYLLDQEKSMVFYPFFKKHGINSFEISLIKSYTVCRETRLDFTHLRMYHQLWLNKNKHSINRKQPFNPLKKIEYKATSKIYRQNNKEYFKQINKAYRDQNQLYFKAYRKQYCQHDK